MAKTLLYIFIAALSFLLASCLDIECVNKAEVQVKTFFYDYNTKQLAVPDTITLHGIDRDEKIYDNKKITPPALLPLRADGNETKFVIEINGTTDTIRFVHSNTFRLISKECGYLMFHTIDSIFFTKHGIDSISLSSKEINFNNIENVAIFY